MLKSVTRLHGCMRLYNKQLMFAHRQVSTSFVKCSTPAAPSVIPTPAAPEIDTATKSSPAEGTTVAEPPTEPEKKVKLKKKGNKYVKRATKDATVGEASGDSATPTKEPYDNAFLNRALNTKGGTFNGNAVIRALIRNKEKLNDQQLKNLIAIGTLFRGVPLVALRRQYLTNLMPILNEQGQKLGIAAMNELMRAKLDNEDQVDVVDFLKQLESRGLELNNLSYELIAKAYARVGNANAIMSILSHLKEEDSMANIHPLLNWLAYAEGTHGNMENVRAIGKASNNEETWHSYTSLYLKAAMGLAKKGDVDKVEDILSKTKLSTERQGEVAAVVEIYMMLLAANRLDALDKLRPFLFISQETNCLPSTVSQGQVMRFLDQFIFDEKFAAVDQILGILPDNIKGYIRWSRLPGKQALAYALHLMDAGKVDEYKSIVDSFKMAKATVNSDAFFEHFIEQYFKRSGKEMTPEEAFDIYLKVTQVETAQPAQDSSAEGETPSIKSRSFHMKTLSRLLRMALSSYQLAKKTDSQSHIYDKILDTVEQYAGKRQRADLQSQVLSDVIGGSVSARRTKGEGSANAPYLELMVKAPKKDTREILNMLEPSAA